MRRLSVLLILAISGCMPQVLHGPHIEEGTSGLINVGIGRNFRFGDDSDAGRSSVPMVNLGLRQGFIGSDGGPAVSVGLQSSAFAIFFVDSENAVEIFGASSFADVYVQPRRYAAATSDFGAGILASTGIAAPYVQYGRTRPNGSSWHTTQGIMTTLHGNGAGVDNVTMWMTGLSWRDLSSTGRTAVIFSADALMGRLNHRTEFLITLSATAELGLAGIR
jgi:hypothetical protein